MRLTKHHGLGNDFLVTLDLPGLQPVGADLVRSVCDRHRGVGADGLIRVTASNEAVATMELHNADGSRAEISGNGLACLAQALVLGGVAPSGTFIVATDAGLREVSVCATAEARTHEVGIDMGPAKIHDGRPDWLEGWLTDAIVVEMGNPHLVLRGPEALGADLDELGRKINEMAPGGINVEVVKPGAMDGELTMTVYERGVGLTQACGSGACAVAAAAKAWGLSEGRAIVHQPGGTALVEVGDTIRLTVPAAYIASVEIPWP